MSKEVKVCFISWHFQNPAVYLQNILKMTPGRSGRWKNMVAVIDPNQADFCAIFDGANVRVPPDRSLYFGEHPDCVPAYSEWENIQAKAKYPLKRFLNPGEWWLDYDYDYLMRLQAPQKTRKLICTFTGHTHSPMYMKRRVFVTKFCQKHPEIDLFGRPRTNFTSDPVLSKFHRGVLGVESPQNVTGDHQTGKEIFINYRYSLEFDVGPTVNYISERFYDALLLWVLPIYYGSSNVHKYIPEGAFRYLDIDGEPEPVMQIVDSDYYEQHISDIARARDLLLNKYQIWPYVYDTLQALGGV